MCGCGVCELFDCYHGVRKRQEINELRGSAQVGRFGFPKVHEPQKYDSGREYGNDETDITVLGPEIIRELVKRRNDPHYDPVVVQDSIVQRGTVHIGQEQQRRRNDTAHEGLLEAVAKVDADPGSAAAQLGVPRKKARNNKPAEAPPSDLQARLEYATQSHGTNAPEGKS